ncbi:MAG: hypothetical protein WCK37_03115 [Candidatus Falkowbacteria bacterium]
MEKKKRRMDLMGRLAKFLLEKDLEPHSKKFEISVLTTLKLVIEDTPEFGRILVSLTFYDRKAKNMNTNTDCANLLSIVKDGMFSSGNIHIHGHRQLKDKVFDIINKTVRYNGRDYGHEEDVIALWKMVGEKIAKTILDETTNKKMGHKKNDDTIELVEIKQKQLATAPSHS